MRLTLRFFALLDVISLFFLSWQVWIIATNYENISPLLSGKIQALLKFPMSILILLGAIGLFRIKRFGFILYYIQFPFRLYLWIFSVGFITLIPEAIDIFNDKLFDIVFKACFVAEFIRLYLTIRIHLKFKQQ